MDFLGHLYNESSKGYTENGAVTYTRTGSALLDFFAQAAAMRGQNAEVLDLFRKAFIEDRLNAIRALFYLRDVRGGQGERTSFRTCLFWILNEYPEVFNKIVHNVPEYGRWDDMFFVNTECFKIIKNQLEKDIKSDHPSLLAKWLPTINARSTETKKKALRIARGIGYSEKEYRTVVRDIRKKLKLVETDMSSNNWGDIDYSKVPSRASMIYRKAFWKHDETRYTLFLNKVLGGSATINAGTLYPYELFEKVMHGQDASVEALWKNLPDFTNDSNILVVADTSGSMGSSEVGGIVPINVSVSLALYCAERSKGAFKDHFITFSKSPKLQHIVGTTLRERLLSIYRAKWGLSTNIQAVFDLILNTAIKNSCTQEELPSSVYIISDMEFNSCTEPGEEYTNLEVIKAKFSNSGYKCPSLVFWNVNARNRNFPALSNDGNVTLVSGCSPSIFRFSLANKTPMESMSAILNSDRYSSITI